MKQQPDYIFEASWEVCNKVGGIYTVLSSRASIMQAEKPDRVIFVGPDLGEKSDIYFREDKHLCFGNIPFRVRIGRWQIPGKPIAVLVDYSYLKKSKNDIYGWAWENYRVMSHAAYGDYDDSCMFGYAAGQVIGVIYEHLMGSDDQQLSMFTNLAVVAHCHEWQTAFTIFFLRFFYPAIKTLFTTHATGIGRSIAGNGKPLYDYFEGYHGDQMAQELNLVSKHSAEKQAAHFCDCFTTVSDITARECRQLLDREVDIVTPNGFDTSMVPLGKAFKTQRVKARNALIELARRVLHEEVDNTAMLIGTSGRPEWRNKGLDVFVDALRQVAGMRMSHGDNDRHIIAFVMVPYADRPCIQIGKTSVIFVPYYLDGHAPFTGQAAKMSYYKLLIGLDLTLFPSYYEPWGYTPHESIAYHIPTVTTSLSGFGVWAQTHLLSTAFPAVTVIARNDSNYQQVVNQAAETVIRYFNLSDMEKTATRRAAALLAQKATWERFYAYYRKAYTIALEKR